MCRRRSGRGGAWGHELHGCPCKAASLRADQNRNDIQKRHRRTVFAAGSTPRASIVRPPAERLRAGHPRVVGERCLCRRRQPLDPTHPLAGTVGEHVRHLGLVKHGVRSVVLAVDLPCNATQRHATCGRASVIGRSTVVVRGDGRLRLQVPNPRRRWGGWPAVIQRGG